MVKLLLKNFWRIFKFWIIAMFCERMDEYEDVTYCMKGSAGYPCNIDSCPKMQKKTKKDNAAAKQEESSR